MRLICLCLPLVLCFTIAAFGQSAGSSSLEAEKDSVLFIKVDNPPSYPGGMDALVSYLAKNVKFPKEARKQHVNGNVYVQFVVNEDGSIDHESVKAIDGTKGNLPKSLDNAACVEEAVRVMRNCPNWNPGTNEGKPVKARFILPIKFKS